MKSFRDYLKEEVLPTVQVADGGLDIEKPAVRAAINAAIASVVSQPAVTPYVVFNRLSKLLAQYHIVLPKRFLEGDKGVEVFEIRQFGHKMGMTDSGEFINEVPSTHYLFLQYGIITAFGITYAKPVVGGMYRVMARLVDKEELDQLLDVAEITMKEEAECNQLAAKARAPKEEMHDVTSDPKKKGNKAAVAASEKGLDEEKNDLKDACWKGYTAKGLKKKGGKMVPNCVPVEEGRMPASVIKHKQKLANMTPEEKAKKFAGKSEEQLKSMARRHGYGKDSNEYSKHLTKEETLDEGFDKIIKGVKRSLKGWPAQPLHGEGGKKPKDVVKRTRGRSDADIKNLASDSNKAAEHSPAGLQKNVAKQEMKRRKLDEKAPPGAKFERMVKHIKKGYSKDGLSAKEKSIAYATAWKAKNRQDEELKFDPSTEIPKNT